MVEETKTTEQPALKTEKQPVTRKCPQIRNWSFCTEDLEYALPNTVAVLVAGTFSGSKAFIDGEWGTTTLVVEVDKDNGRFFTTQNKTRYELVGPPDPDFVAFLRKKGFVPDPDSNKPFTVRKKT